MSITELKALAKRYQYISFDIFDTLLFRAFKEPSQVFKAVERMYSIEYNKPNFRFYSQRIAAEKKARDAKFPFDVTLDDIYGYLNYNKTESDCLKGIEQQCEINNCFKNDIMIDFLSWCKSHGKVIIIITDMYLDRGTIMSILSKIGVTYDKLYISSETGLTKRSGDLFDYVLNDLKLLPSQLLHIGDDLNNDIKQPNNKGVAAALRITNRLDFDLFEHDDFLMNHIDSIYINWIDGTERTIEKEIGFRYLGPFCVNLCQWIHKLKKKKGLDKLLFVAREGFLLKQVYGILYPEENESVQYVRLNKNMLRMPSMMVEDSVESFIKSLPERKLISWNEIFQLLCIQDRKDIFKRIIAKYPSLNLSEEFYLNNLLIDNSSERSIFLSIVDACYPIIKNQYEALLKYLAHLGFFSSKVGLVNNSMNGSGQSMIESFIHKLGIECEVFGLQIIHTKLCRCRLQDRFVSWASDLNISSYKYEYFLASSLVLEHLLFEPVGTALYFDECGDVICEEQKSESRNNTFVGNIQSFTKDFATIFKNNICIDLGKCGFNRIIELLVSPTKEIANSIARIYDEDISSVTTLVDESVNLPKFFMLLPRINLRVKWIYGYIAIKYNNKAFLYLFQIRVFLRHLLSKIIQ